MSTPKQRKELKALARKAYDALYVLNNIKWTHYRDRIRELAEQEEKAHRRGFKPDGISIPASVRDAAIHFTVKRIAEALIGKRPLTVADYLSVQESAFYAQSVVANYEKECREALKEFDLSELAAMDYCVLVGSDTP